MWPVSESFLASLRTTHRVATEVDVFFGDTKQNAAPLPIVDGSITVDGSSKVRRTLDLTIDHSRLNTEQADALYNPFGRELHVRSGIRYPNGSTELVPVGVFRYDADEDAVDRQGGLKITAPDRARAMQDFRFVEPTSADSSITIPVHVQRFINDTFPGLALQDQTGDATVTPAAVWDQDRWDACVDLATAVAAEVFFRGDGLPVLRYLPKLTDTPAWRVDVGAAGVMIGGQRRKSREATYSGVTARGERTDGTAPSSATVWDTDPASPTNADGPFGRVPRFISNPFITSNAQAAQVAAALLPKYTSQQRQLTLTAVPNPALDVGDTIDVAFPDGRVERHLIERLGIPLTREGQMSVGTRSDSPEVA